MKLVLRFAWPLLLLVLGGCGGGSSTVSGKVTVDGAPLTNGSVRFVPDSSKGNKETAEPIGVIEKDGTYKLATNGKPGAPTGWYKVSVSSTTEADSTNPYAMKSNIATKYNDPDKSGISIEITSSASPGAYDIKVTAK